jgi:hypothetical protein
VRPTKDVRDVPLKSVQKRWKEKIFAAGVDRDHVEAATADFSRHSFGGALELWDHVGNVLAAMQGRGRRARARRPSGAAGLKRFALALALLLAAGAGFYAGRSGRPSATLAPPFAVEQAPIGGLAVSAAIDLPALPDAPVRNLILAVADGLGVAELAAARIRAFGPDGRFVFERLPVAGLVVTHPTDRLVAKSDSSANAIAAGVRTPIGRIGLAADGTPLETLLESGRGGRSRHRPGLHEPGLRRHAGGVLRARHETPRLRRHRPPARRGAGRPRRRWRRRAVLRRGAGGGARARHRRGAHARRARGGAPAALGALPRQAARRGAGTPDARRDGRARARAARRRGARRGSGFFLLLEEEGIDTASHAHDLERLTAAALRFDAAVERAVRFAAPDGAHARRRRRRPRHRGRGRRR